MTIFNESTASSDHGWLSGILMFVCFFNVSSKVNTKRIIIDVHVLSCYLCFNTGSSVARDTCYRVYHKLTEADGYYS